MGDHPATPTKANVRLQIWGIVVGALLTFAPVFATMGTVMEMYRAFANLAAGSGIENPSGVSIKSSLASTTLRFVLVPIGLVILILSLISYSRRMKALREKNPNQARSSETF